MKKKYFIVIILLVSVIIPFQLSAQEGSIFRQEGIASWYGREFEGRPTASGEIFNASQLTAAHPNLPFGTILIVTNLHNNKSVTVRVNDRGPFVPLRIIDVSRAAAEQLDMIVTGTAPVRVESTNRVVVTGTTVGAQMQPQSAAPVVPQVVAPSVTVITPVPQDIQTTPAPVSYPVVMAAPSQVRLSPSLSIVPDRKYRLQVGSFRVARNAVDAFDRLKGVGLTPAYERHTDNSNVEYYRVVLAGINGTDIQSTSEKLSAAGFRDAIIREEH